MEKHAIPSAAALDSILTSSKNHLLSVRQLRPPPHLDNKILVSWNGLMIASATRASRVLSNSSYHEVAVGAANFIEKHLYDAATETLLRTYCDGPSAIPGYLDDYAFMIHGLLELYQTDFNAKWLNWALTLQLQQDARFWDERRGGYYSCRSGFDCSDPHAQHPHNTTKVCFCA